MEGIRFSNMEQVKQEVWAKYQDKPTRFKEVLIYFSKSNIFEEAILEWKTTGTNINNPEDIETCICSQHIENLYYVYNDIVSCTLVVGSSCIEKFGSARMKEDLKIVQKVQRYIGNFRPCLNCGDNKIQGEDGKLYCNYCLITEQSYPSNIMLSILGTKKCSNLICNNLVPNIELVFRCRECQGGGDYGCLCCGSINNNGNIRCNNCSKKEISLKCVNACCYQMISFNDPYRTKCKLCLPSVIQELPLEDFRNNKPIIPNRICKAINCNIIIPTDEPDWKPLCKQCYILSKRKGYIPTFDSSRKCKTNDCNNFLNSNQPKFHSFCNKCYYKNK